MRVHVHLRVEVYAEIADLLSWRNGLLVDDDGGDRGWYTLKQSRWTKPHDIGFAGIQL